jgi:hypothetical protein
MYKIKSYDDKLKGGGTRIGSGIEDREFEFL